MRCVKTHWCTVARLTVLRNEVLHEALTYHPLLSLEARLPKIQEQLRAPIFSLHSEGVVILDPSGRIIASSVAIEESNVIALFTSRTASSCRSR